MKGFYWIYVAVIGLVVIVALSYYSPEKSITGEVIVNEAVSTGDYMDVSSMEAQNLINNNPDLVIVDVSPNYDRGHLPGAVNYYVGDGSLDTAIPMLDMSAMYLVYCHFDSASRAGAQKLVDAGFENVYRLEDHYGGWVDGGYLVDYSMETLTY